VQNYQLFKM